MGRLNTRFEAFVHAGKGFENIDTLLRHSVLPEKKRADYLLLNRQIIIEQKSLDTDPVYKAESFVNDLFASRGIFGYGQFGLAPILNKLSDGEKVKADFHAKMTKIIDDIIAHADKQTKDTREIFMIPASLGVVVILNEAAGSLFPDAVRYRVQKTLCKKARDGALRYPHNDVVIIISEAHKIKGLSTVPTIPILMVVSASRKRGDIALAFANDLARNWAAFNGASYTENKSEAMVFEQRKPRPLQLDLAGKVLK